MDVSIFSDPKIIGPGIWFKMHLDAVYAITDSTKSTFIHNINILCDNFKCKNCQDHFRKFITNNNLIDYWNIKDNNGSDIGFFKWTWELHNQVNRFLGKYEPSLEEAYKYYSNVDSGVCFDCGDNKSSEQRTLAIPSILMSYLESGNIKPQRFQ